MGVRRRSSHVVALLTAQALLTAGAVSAAPLAPQDWVDRRVDRRHRRAGQRRAGRGDLAAGRARPGTARPRPRPHTLLVTRQTAARLRAEGIALRPEDGAAPAATAASLAATPGRLGIFDGWWSQVRNLEAIHQRLDELEQSSPGRARVLTLGRSVEGRADPRPCRSWPASEAGGPRPGPPS